MYKPKCKKCSNPFDWKKILNSNFNRFRAIECNKCHTLNFPSSVYKVTSSMLELIPVSMLAFYDPIVVPVALMVIIPLIAPFFARYELDR